MKGLEAAIRKALAKSSNSTPESRSRLYQSARSALESSLEKQGITDPEKLKDYYRQFHDTIAEIEKDEKQRAALRSNAPSADKSTAPQASIRPIAPGAPTANPPVSPASPKVDPTKVRSGQSDIGSAEDISVQSRAASSDVPTVDAPISRAGAQGGFTAPSDQFATRAEPEIEVAARIDPVRGPADVVPEVAPVPEKGSVSGPAPVENGSVVAPTVVADPTDTARIAGRQDSEDPTVSKTKVKNNAKRQKQQKKRARPIYSILLVLCVLGAFIGIGAYWTVTSGLLDDIASRDNSVPNPLPSTETDDFAGATPPGQLGAQNFSDAWISVFDAGNLSGIETEGGALVEQVNTENGPAIRIASSNGGASGEVRIEFRPGILQILAGKNSTVALSLRSSGDQPTQIYVKCDFGTLGDCGRRRFDVNYENSDIIFKLGFERGLAPNRSGFMVLNSDITGQGQSIDLFAIRVLPGN